MSVFTDGDNEKVDKIIKLSDDLYDYLQASIATNTIDRNILSKDYLLNDSETDYIDKKKNNLVSFTRKLISSQLIIGIIYCYFHSRKIIKLNLGVIKSLYCWGGLLSTCYFTIAYSMVKFKSSMQKECEILYIKKFIPSVTDDQIALNLRDYLSIYKRIKFVEKHMI